MNGNDTDTSHSERNKHEKGKPYYYMTANKMTYELLKEHARHNRSHPTQVESIMWELLKGKRLGASFRRQHIIGEYIADFTCLENKLVIEIDGKYHEDRQQKEDDKLRTQQLNAYGFKVMRFTNEQVISDTETVIKMIKEQINTETL